MATNATATVELVARLDALRDEMGGAWRPGWQGIVDDEAGTIIDELRSRETSQAREALIAHGLGCCVDGCGAPGGPVCPVCGQVVCDAHAASGGTCCDGGISEVP